MVGKQTQLGLIIKNARIDCGLTQEELAARTGITCRYMIAIENEGKIPKYETLYKIIHRLNISADLIFYPSTPRKNPEKEQLLHLLEVCSDHDIHVLLCTAKGMLEHK